MIRRALATAAVVATLAAAGCSTGIDAASRSNNSADVTVSVGTKTFAPADRVAAPAVTGTLLDGSSFDLASTRGRVVVLNIWGAWCANCRAETADLQAVYAKVAPKGVAFVGIDVYDSHDAATSYVEAHQIAYPSIFDTPGRTLLSLRDVPPQAVPSTIVIDAAGKIASIHVGTVTRDELTDMIAKASP